MSETRSTNWEQVKQLFEQVLAQPFAERDAFLARATREDEALRHEVQALIKSDEQAQAESFLEQPTAHLAAESLLEGHGKLKAGERLTHYEIVTTIGEGGMGDVYHAWDPKLDRPVAIKVLSSAIGADADGLARFRARRRGRSPL